MEQTNKCLLCKQSNICCISVKIYGLFIGEKTAAVMTEWIYPLRTFYGGQGGDILNANIQTLVAKSLNSFENYGDAEERKYGK